MKLIVTAILCAAMLGCSKETVTGLDGRKYIRVERPGNAAFGVPGTEAIYQVAGATGSGKPAYIRSLGSKDSFTRVGDLP